MKNCNKCNNKITDDSDFCKFCGAPQHENASLADELDDSVNAVADGPSGKWNTTQLFWSIINIWVCTNSIGVILGIIALVQTNMAKKASTAEEESRRLKIANTCNIIGILTTVGFLIVIFSLLLFK